MPNPRYLVYPDYDKETGEPTVELLDKMSRAKDVYYTNLARFCMKHIIDINDMSDIERVYLIGSHATDTDWHNETSDLDLKLINPSVPPMYLHQYKREVLDPKLNQGEDKNRWIDLFFAREDYQVTKPRWDLTYYWMRLDYGLLEEKIRNDGK